MRTVAWLVTSWAAGLGAYAGALNRVRGDVLSLDNWTVIGAVTLVAWLASALLVTLPVLRHLPPPRSRPASAARLSIAGASLAIVPVWLTLVVWHGWHPRHLLSQEAAFLGLLYGTSGAVLGLLLSRLTAPRASWRAR